MRLTSLKTCRAIFLFLLFFASSQGLSQADWTLFGVRPLGMGNAFVAVADDFNALFYNPAGLARIKEWEMEIVNPRVDLSLNSYYLARKVLPELGKMSTANALQLVNDEAGLPNYVGFGISPYYIAPGWGFAIGNQNYLSFTAHKNVDVQTQALSKLDVPISYAMNFLSNRLSIGASLKFESVYGINQDISIDTISLLSSSSSTSSSSSQSKTIDNLLISGAGVGIDLGLLFTPMETMEPTFGMSITDFGGTNLRKFSKDGSTAPNIPPAVNTGISLKPYKSTRSYILVALDTQTINQATHFSHKLNIGLEWGFSKIIKLETGLMDGNPTAGLQFDVGLLKLRLATYVVDTGPVVGLDPKLVDRRIALQIKLLI